jgi:predicted metal-dependent phosphoesterase TrpH
MFSNLALSPSLRSKAIAQNTENLTEVWQNLDYDSCPYHYNFHLHTVCSDGQLLPSQVMDQAIAIGLKGLAITDHHSIKGYQQAQTYLETIKQESPEINLPDLWIGVEITANVINTEVHLLGYGFDPYHSTLEPYFKGYSPQGQDAKVATVIDCLHQAGGLVVLAHPARYRRPAAELIPAVVDLGIDGVEAYYAYGHAKPWQPSPIQTQLVQKLGEKYGLFHTCGTDSHGVNILERI